MPNLSGLATGVAIAGVQRNYRFYAANGRNRMRKYDGENWRNCGINGVYATITRTADAAGTVTITTASAHGFAVSDKVRVRTYNNSSTYNGDVTIASTPTTTTFTYAQGAATISAADNGGRVQWIPTTAAQTAVVKGITGTYYYYVVPINANHRVYGNRVVSGMPSPLSAPVSPNNQSVLISTIPATHADPQVTHWAIYRNKNAVLDSNTQDQENEYWKIAEVAVGTTSFVDEFQDDSLPPETLDFRVNIPPTFKAMAVFGERCFGTGFDAISTGTATVNSVTTLVDFTGVSLPDGVVGCKFKKDGDDAIYEIMERPTTTQIALDKPFSGALSAATYQIFRDESELYISEWNDFDAWGTDSEAKRNKLYIGRPGSGKKSTALVSLNDNLWVFTKDQIYRVNGQGFDIRNIGITPNPFYDGAGCVGPNAVVSIDNQIFFWSYRGPMVFDGSGAPQPIYQKIGPNWLDELNASQLQICAAGYSPTRNAIKFALPATGETENSIVWVYQRDTGTWWREQYVHPACYFYDYDSSGNPALYYGQGQFIFQDDTGTTDGVPSGTTTGTVTATTTTTITDSTAAFYTTGSGLKERYVHIYSSAGVLRGHRRITSNTGTQLTWSTSGSGGGTLSVTVGDTYFVGPVLWWWTTASKYIPSHAQRTIECGINFDLQGEGTISNLYGYDIKDTTERTTPHKFAINVPYKKFSVNSRNFEWATRIECRETGNQVSIRDITLIDPQDKPQEKEK